MSKSSRSKMAVITALVATGYCSIANSGPVTSIEGSGGGGLATWALLAQDKPTVSVTEVAVQDYDHRTAAVLGSVADRVELSYARLTLDSGDIGLGNVNMDVLGIKGKLLDMSSNFATVSVGLQYKKNHDLPTAVMTGLGIKSDSGVDSYVAATKVFPVGGKNVLLNGTVRFTKANQIGYFGFGTTSDNNYKAYFEGSAALFLRDDLILGAEYRNKPDHITGLKEDAWWNIFAGYFFSRQFSVVAAYANLGNIAAEITPHGANQSGAYLQAQYNF